MLGCYKRNNIGLERFSLDNEWLTSDICLSNGCWSREEYNLCSVQEIEVDVDWSSVVMWGSITMSNSAVAGANAFSYLLNLLIGRYVTPTHFSTNRW